jgi:hypothetical protein
LEQRGAKIVWNGIHGYAALRCLCGRLQLRQLRRQFGRAYRTDGQVRMRLVPSAYDFKIDGQLQTYIFKALPPRSEGGLG